MTFKTDGQNPDVEEKNIPEENGDFSSDSENNEKEPVNSPSDATLLAQELALEKDKVLRLAAEFENYKKRKQREIDDFKKFANETILKQFLSVVDNMERAIDSVKSKDQKEEPLSEKAQGLLNGVELIHKEILTILENFHVRPVKAQDQPFDHDFHQAVTQEEVDNVPDKTIIRVLQKGYAFHDRLLRPAMVVVSKKPVKDEQQMNEIG